MKEKDFSDDEIQVLGKQTAVKPFFTKRKLFFVIAALAIGIILLCVFLFQKNEEPTNFVRLENLQTNKEICETQNIRGYIEVENDTVNDVPLQIFIPQYAMPELTLALPEESDSTVVFVTQAADVGRRNYGIVGDFVLAGEQLARGYRKEGFCAIINNNLTIGIGTETSLLGKAISEKGYFFRQYPLVKNYEAIENNPKNKAVRRALAIRENEVIMVESRERESFHDFTQALVDVGVSDAIYLVGGNAFGWYRTENNEVITFGDKANKVMAGVNYLVWRR